MLSINKIVKDKLRKKKLRSMEMQFSQRKYEPKSMQQGQQIKYKNNNDQ